MKRNLWGGQRGEVSIGSILMMSIGLIFMAVGFIMFPNVTDAASNILNYTYSGNNTITCSTYTGLTATVGILPLLVLLGYVSVAVIAGFMGYKVSQGMGSTRLSPGGFLMLGISLVFIALGLYIFPVLLDGISSIVSAGISSSFTGLSAIILMVPMLVLLGFIVATVISGMFGIKTLTSGD